MKLNFGKIIELIFPLSEDELRIANCGPSDFASKLCTEKRGDIEGLAPFKDQELRSALHLVKFHHHKKAALLLSELLKRRLVALPYAQYMLIPIPLSSQRLRERGHNQVATIAEHAIKSFPHLILVTDILIKDKNTKPQTTLTKKERETNVTGAFSVKPEHLPRLKGKRIILLDDVTTTGATLKAASTVVQKGGPLSIHCMAVAY
jgi:ComF family protein